MNPRLCHCGRFKPKHLAACVECFEMIARKRDRLADEAEARGDKLEAARQRLLAQMNRTEANTPAPSPLLDQHLFPSLFED